MTTSEMVPRDLGAVPLRHKLPAILCVGAAKLLAKRPPRQIRAMLNQVRRGAKLASPEQTALAIRMVTATTLECRGTQGCLPRSLAAALLCRTWGVWPTWCAGVRRIGPFGAHAWLEVDGVMVGEPYPDHYFQTVVTVPRLISSRDQG